MQKIIEERCKLVKENLGIRMYSRDWKNNKNITEVIDPDIIDSIILTRPSTLSTDIFKLNKNIQISIFNGGIPTHLIISLDKIPKIIDNYTKMNKMPNYKKRKIAYIFCKGVCSGRIKVI